MKRILVALALAASAMVAMAEPTFDQMQDLIAQKQYAAAEQGLEVIIKNHPTSAKAFYSMAQAQAGLGHLDKAQFALDKARGLDPTLKFASSANVEALQAAITPQVKKIEKVESGFSWLAAFLTAIAMGIIGWIAYLFYRKEKKVPQANETSPNDDDLVNYRLDPLPNSLSPAAAPVGSAYTSTKRVTTSDDYASTYTPAPRVRAPLYSAPAPVVEHHYHNTSSSSSSNDLMTGVMLGSMMNNHHDTTRVIEREVVREVPVYRETPSRSSSLTSSRNDDDDSSSSWSSSSSTRSPSWDDDSSSRSSSSSSSSWGSSSSSSSWDSGSSSSDSSSSSSSSSWD